MDDQQVFVLGGDPGSIKASAATWQSFSLESTAASAQLSAIGSLSAVSFRGDEGQTHSDLLLLDMAPQLAVLADAWGRAGGALDAYSGALAESQAELRRLAAIAAQDKARVTALDGEFAMAQAADARHASAVALAAQQPTAAIVVAPQWISSQSVSTAPGAQARLTEAQVGLAAIYARARQVRSQHDDAQRRCVQTINAAAALAPAIQPAVRPGSRGSNGMRGAWTMASPLTLASAGLRLASTTSTRYAALPGFTVAEVLLGNSFLNEPVDPPDPIYQSPEDYEPVPADIKAQLRPRLRAVCLMNSKNLGPDQIGDADMLCQGFADSALQDMGHLRRALLDFPQVGAPQLPQLTPWAALWEGVTDMVKFTAQVADYGACVDGDKSGCAADLGFAMLGPVFGALKKAGETAGWVVKMLDKAGDAKKAVQDSKAVTKAKDAAHRLAEAKAAKQALTKRVNEFRDAVKPVKPGQEQVPEAWLPVVAEKIPKDWPLPKRGKPSNDTTGKMTIRFGSGTHGRSTVRIDRGNPNSSFPSQRVDHVVVTSNGRLVGRDGGAFTPSDPPTDDELVNMHIPFAQWKDWSSWNHP